MENRVDDEVLNAIHSGHTSIRRRLEIYEADGETLWMGSSDTPRMVGGAVTVDYSRAERRAVDLTLDNSDGVLEHDPDGFWYDKVLKVYRGLEYRNTKTIPSILVVRDDTQFIASVIPHLRKIGFKDITNRHGLTTTLDHMYGYDIILLNAAHSEPTQPEADLLKKAYDAGFNILTIGDDTPAGKIPFITAAITKGGTENWMVNKPTEDTPMSRGWNSFQNSVDPATGKLPTVLAATARPAAYWTYTSTVTFPAVYDQAPNGARWFHYQPYWAGGTNSLGLFRSAIEWLYSYADTRVFETQVGEFQIDSIDEDHFPSLIRVVGRDYTKKLLGNKFEQAVTFSSGLSLDAVVKAIATNAGIHKTFLDSNGAFLGSDISFDRTTERWKAIYDMCTSNGVEVYFNPQGYLATRPFLDPFSSPTSVTLKTGEPDGNLVSWNKKSNDSRIFNVIVVNGENQNDLAGGAIWQGRATNTEPSSPTRIERLGARHYFFTSPYLRSNEACQTLANQLLRIHALEEFELNWTSLAYPWLEVGEIAGFEDPQPGRDEPDRYLLSTLSIPMTLGPMSGTGKRVTIVGSGSNSGGA